MCEHVVKFTLNLMVQIPAIGSFKVYVSAAPLKSSKFPTKLLVTNSTAVARPIFAIKESEPPQLNILVLVLLHDFNSADAVALTKQYVFTKIQECQIKSCHVIEKMF